MTLADLALYVVLPLLGLALLLALWRLLRGPHTADRVVALDLMVTLGLGIIAGYAIATDQVALLDVALVVALVAFLGTTAIASYLQRRPEA